MSIYITSPNSTCPFVFLLPTSLPSPITRQVIYFLSLQLILYFLEFSINRIMYYMLFLGSGGSGFFCSDILVNTWYYLNVVLIWIFLMAKDIKPVLLFHAFTSLNEVFVQIFHFVLDCFLITEIWRFILYFGYKAFYRHMIFNIFSTYLVYLFILWTQSLKEQ